MYFILTIWFLVIIKLISNYFKTIYNFWKKRNIPTPPYKWIFGNLLDSITLKRSMGIIHTKIYRDYEGYNYVGFYKFFQPGVIIRSPELINEVLVKSFSSFEDNDYDVDVDVDYIFGNNPFVAHGDRWKELRNRMTPSFGASKVKAMMPLINENADKLTKYLKESDGPNNVTLEVKELALKYTCDNVASCGFGLDGKSFTDPKATFLTKAKKLFDPNFFSIMKQNFVLVIPSLSRIFNIRFFPKEFTQLLEDIVFQTIDYRKKNNVVRGDYLDFMKETMEKINDENIFSMKDIVAQSGAFFFDAFETSGIAISNILYEIGANPIAQRKLYNEIKEVLKTHENKLSYAAINDMVYLDCVIKESLRKNVPLLILLKRCTTEYRLPTLMANGKGPRPIITPGTPIVIPVYALHHDPKYFPNPEIFDPDRFSEENKNKIVKGTYLPFGDGPRMCVGSRFGLLQTKICVVTIVRDFLIEVSNKTRKPLEVESKAFFLAYVGGLWLNFKPRNDM